MSTHLGLEVLLDTPDDLLKGRRVGLVVSASSVDSLLRSTIECLYRHPEINLTALFGPEHGLRGEAQAGERVGFATDRVTGLPVYSLYGDTQKPTQVMLENVDALVVDMQDGGVRFYTYLYTMAYTMQAAAEAGLPVIVLDRPAPLGGTVVQGPVLDPAYASFVGLYPIPIRYGMTIGEIACLFNEAFGIGCDLHVVWMENWQRAMWYDDTGLPFIPPSPNLPTLSAMTAFPGTCLIEGTNLSEGRGTTKPFEYLGAPWITDPEALVDRMNNLELPGVRFRPVYFVPTFSKHQGQPCRGLHLFVTDRTSFRPIETVLYILEAVTQAYPADFSWREPWTPGGHYPIDLLTGGSAVREHLTAGKPIPDLVSTWQEPLQQFSTLRASFLHYAG